MQRLRVFGTDSYLVAQFTARHKPFVAFGYVPIPAGGGSEDRPFAASFLKAQLESCHRSFGLMTLDSVDYYQVIYNYEAVGYPSSRSSPN